MPTLAFNQSPLGKTVLAPVPAKAGQPVCLFFESAPSRSRWEIYNLAGERISSLSFDGPSGHCWNTAQAVPGLYFIRASFEDAQGSKVIWQKVAITK
jgi:hypothetical protein